MVINDLDHDVEELLIEDMPDDTPETAQYIISQIELNKAGEKSRESEATSSLLKSDSRTAVLHVLFPVPPGSK